MIDSLSIAVRTFVRYVVTSLSADETQLPRYMSLSSNFREPGRNNFGEKPIPNTTEFTLIERNSEINVVLLGKKTPLFTEWTTNVSLFRFFVAQSARAVEYTDSTSAEGWDPH